MLFIANINLFGQVKIIYDTDFDSDIDDVGALYLLYTLADQNKVEILGTILSSTHFWSPFALDAVNTFWGHPDMPIGAPFTDGVNKGSVYAETIAKTFPNDMGQLKELEEATHLYRRILASQADSSVTLLTVGHLTNISKLLASVPDESSPLPGHELVRKKVKCWVAMLGLGMNWNMKWDRDASMKAINEFPVPTIMTVEGQDVKTGSITQDLPYTNPIRTVYRLWNEHYGEINRSSWDQIAALFAVVGENDYFKTERGFLQFTQEAGAVWNPDLNGPDYRLYNKIPNEALADIIENLMIQEPQK